MCSRSSMDRLRPGYFLRMPRFENGLVEERKVDSGPHHLIAGVARVEVVAGIDVGQEDGGLGGIAGDFVEVDDAIEDAAGADPLVVCFANLLAGIGGIPGADIRSQRGAEDLDAVLVSAGDQLRE